MVDNPVNLATRHDKRIRIQLIKVAVIDSRRRTSPGKLHASIATMSCSRAISEGKARQPKRLRGLERRHNNSWHTIRVGAGRCVRFRGDTPPAQWRYAGKKWLRLPRPPLVLLRRRLAMALAREVVENDSFVRYHRGTKIPADARRSLQRDTLCYT